MRLMIFKGEVCMEIDIIKGSIYNIDDCEEALVNSELGRKYFSKAGSTRKALEDEVEQWNQ